VKKHILLLLLLCSSAAEARENCYDVLAKTLAPFTAIFSTSKTNASHTVKAELSVMELTGLPQGFAGTRVSLALSPPDKIRVSSQFMDQPCSICRNGQEIWALPGTEIGAMLGQTPSSAPPKSNIKLPDLALPIPEKEFVFLPALFEVGDGGDEPVNDVACRVLDVKLMAELARSLNVTGWSARVWVNPAYKPVRVELNGPQWHGVINVEALDFPAALPADTWKPAPDETDILRLNPNQILELCTSVGLVKQNKK
jgi:hypothetical protein